jgi:AcrR family transcriptional regulator
MNARRPRRDTPGAGHRTRVGRERRARTHERIVAAALGVFAEKGPDAPVIEDFIHAAGVARGTFYNHFTSTAELLVATSRWLEDDLIRSIQAEIRGLEDPVARLITGLRMWLRKSQQDPAWCAFVVRSRTRGRLVERQLTADLRAGLRARALSAPSVEVARDLVVGAALEAMSRILRGRVPRTYADDVVRVVLRGLGLDERSIAQGMSLPVPEVAAR